MVGMSTIPFLVGSGELTSPGIYFVHVALQLTGIGRSVFTGWGCDVDGIAASAGAKNRKTAE
jgi:hypothetical protein